MAAETDGRLVELCRGSDEAAFAELVGRHRRALLAYATRLTHSDAAAEDAVQQALLQAWMAIRRDGTEIHEVRAWLYRIVHNQAVSAIRRQRLEDRVPQPPKASRPVDVEFESRMAV